MKAVPLKWLCEVNPETPEFRPLAPSTEVSFVPLEAVWPGERFDASRVRPWGEVSGGYTRFREGDVLLPRITPTFQADRSTIARGLQNGLACGTTELHVLRARKGVDPRFVLYSVKRRDFLALGEAAMTAVAGQQRVPASFVESFPVLALSEADQRNIADVLDRETARIDAIVTAKDRLVQVLSDRSQAVIDRMTVEGSPTRVMHLTDPDRPVMYGIVLPGPHVEDGVPIVKGGDVAARRLHRDILSRTSAEIEARYARSRLRGGDLVVSIRGSVGEVATVPDALTGANLTQDAARVSPANDVDGRWLRYALCSSGAQRQMGALTTGATIRGLNIMDLKRVVLPKPPIESQRQIADVLDLETARTERLIEMTERQLGLLGDHREALIRAAVTGQIDVMARMRGEELTGEALSA